MREIQAKQLNVETDIICSKLKIGNLDVNYEILLLKEQVKQLQEVIKNLTDIRLQ